MLPRRLSPVVHLMVATIGNSYNTSSYYSRTRRTSREPVQFCKTNCIKLDLNLADQSLIRSKGLERRVKCSSTDVERMMLIFKFKRSSRFPICLKMQVSLIVCDQLDCNYNFVIDRRQVANRTDCVGDAASEDCERFALRTLRFNPLQFEGSRFLEVLDDSD